VAMVYSTYAIYASGLEAVLGGMLVMASGYVIYGFLATRFTGEGAWGSGAARDCGGDCVDRAASERASRVGGHARPRARGSQTHDRVSARFAPVLVSRRVGKPGRLFDRAVREGRSGSEVAARIGHD
jgi:hypothetical protein